MTLQTEILSTKTLNFLKQIIFVKSFNSVIGSLQFIVFAAGLGRKFLVPQK